MADVAAPAIIVHGGAWSIPDHLAAPSKQGVKEAVRRGHVVLDRGGSALDAVMAAVVSLEDDPAFDAGTGSVLNARGEVEMDSVVMDGATLAAGAVACVQNIRNPVQLARMVMDKTDHTMLVGAGANQFAAEMGVPSVPAEDLVTEEALAEYHKLKQFRRSVQYDFKPRLDVGHDTVGAVALDRQGHVAVAVSTGGITAKRPGRVGDSPLIGCGAYADDGVGGTATTGHGEAITKVCLAHLVHNLMQQGLTPQAAAERGLTHMLRRVDGTGGLVVLGRDGSVGHSCTTQRMAWAWARGAQSGGDGPVTLHYGLEPDDDLTEDLDHSAELSELA